MKRFAILTLAAALFAPLLLSGCTEEKKADAPKAETPKTDTPK